MARKQPASAAKSWATNSVSYNPAMQPLISAVRFLIENIAGFFALALLCRFYLQVARAPFQHPFPQFLLALTNWCVIPVRRVIKGVAGYDTATILLGWLTVFIRDSLLLSLQGVSLHLDMASAWIGMLLLSVTHVVQLSIYLLFGAVLVQAVLSFVAPYNPLAPILTRLTNPLLKPLQKVLPPMGGIDLSPMLLILILQLVLMVPVTYAENGAFALLRSAAAF